MKILLTGCTGFLGHHLYQKLRPDHDFTLLSRQAPPGRPDSRSTWIPHDLRESSLPSSLPRAIDVLYHFAAQTGAASIEDRDEHHRVNTVATLQLLEYAKSAGAKAFVYASSGGVYGIHENPAREDDPVAPCDFYNQTKFESEMLVQEFAAHFRIAILRFFFLYGPGQKRSRLVMSLIDRIRHGQRVLLQNGGKPMINPIHIADAVDAVCRVSTLSENCVLNIAGSETTDIRRLSLMIGGALAREPVFEDVDAPGLTNLLGDTSLMHRMLGFQPRVGLAEGIRSTVATEDPRD